MTCPTVAGEIEREQTTARLLLRLIRLAGWKRNSDDVLREWHSLMSKMSDYRDILEQSEWQSGRKGRKKRKKKTRQESGTTFLRYVGLVASLPSRLVSRVMKVNQAPIKLVLNLVKVKLRNKEMKRGT